MRVGKAILRRVLMTCSGDGNRRYTNPTTITRTFSMLTRRREVVNSSAAARPDETDGKQTREVAKRTVVRVHRVAWPMTVAHGPGATRRAPWVPGYGASKPRSRRGRHRPRSMRARLAGVRQGHDLCEPTSGWCGHALDKCEPPPALGCLTPGVCEATSNPGQPESRAWVGRGLRSGCRRRRLRLGYPRRLRRL